MGKSPCKHWANFLSSKQPVVGSNPTGGVSKKSPSEQEPWIVQPGFDQQLDRMATEQPRVYGRY